MTSRNCKICGKELPASSHAYYCSQCRQKGRLQTLAGTELVCIFCGKPFTPKSNRQEHCNNQCREKHKWAKRKVKDAEQRRQKKLKESEISPQDIFAHLKPEKTNFTEGMIFDTKEREK